MSVKFAKSKLIAITGNICSGKTEFLSALKKQGHETISTDEIVDGLWQDKNNLAKIADTFSLSLSMTLQQTKPEKSSKLTQLKIHVCRFSTFRKTGVSRLPANLPWICSKT